MKGQLVNNNRMWSVQPIAELLDGERSHVIGWLLDFLSQGVRPSCNVDGDNEFITSRGFWPWCCFIMWRLCVVDVGYRRADSWHSWQNISLKAPYYTYVVRSLFSTPESSGAASQDYISKKLLTSPENRILSPLFTAPSWILAFCWDWCFVARSVPFVTSQQGGFQRIMF